MRLSLNPARVLHQMVFASLRKLSSWPPLDCIPSPNVLGPASYAYHIVKTRANVSFFFKYAIKPNHGLMPLHTSTFSRSALLYEYINHTNSLEQYIDLVIRLHLR